MGRSGNKHIALVKDTLVFAVGTGLSKLVLFLLLPLYTSVMSADSYGTAELVYNFLQVIFPLLSLCVAEAVFRYAVDDNEERDMVFRLGIRLVLLGIALLAAVCSILLLVFRYEFALDFLVLYTAFSLVQVLEYYVRGLGHFRLFALGGVSNALVIAFSSWLYLCVLELDVRGYLLAFASGYIAEMVILCIGERGRLPIRGHVPKDVASSAFRYCLPIIPSVVSWWFANASSRYFIGWLLGLAEAGLFSAASKYSALVNMLTDVFAKAWQYAASKELGKEDPEYFKETFEYYLAFLVISTSGCLIIIQPLCSLTLAGEFYDAWVYAPFLIIAASVNGLSSFFGSFYTAAKQTFMAMVSTVLGAVVNVVGIVALLPLFGIAGAAMANVVSFAVIALIRMVDTKRYVDVGIKWGKVGGQFLILLMQAAVLVSLDWGGMLYSSVFFVALMIVNRSLLVRLSQMLVRRLGRAR